MVFLRNRVFAGRDAWKGGLEKEVDFHGQLFFLSEAKLRATKKTLDPRGHAKLLLDFAGEGFRRALAVLDVSAREVGVGFVFVLAKQNVAVFDAHAADDEFGVFHGVVDCAPLGGALVVNEEVLLSKVLMSKTS